MHWDRSNLFERDDVYCAGTYGNNQKTRLNSSKENFKAKSSRLSTKRNLSTLLNFVFPLVSFKGVFSTLKYKPLVLKATTWWTRASHFVDGWHLLRCKIRRLLSHPLCGCPFDFCGGGGMSGLFWARIFFPKPLELEIFSLTYNGVRFFFSIIYVMREILFGEGYYFSLVYPSFSPLKSVYRIFFSEITHNLLNSQLIGR